MVLIRIYKIWSELGNMVYVGSTEKTIAERFSRHKISYRAKQNGANNSHCSSVVLFDSYGPENCIITEICAVLCETKTLRKELEASYIKHWQERQEVNCVNKQLPGRTITQYKFDTKQQKIERDSEYRKKNKEILSAKQKIKHACECGGNYTNSSKARHLKTEKHQLFILA